MTDDIPAELAAELEQALRAGERGLWCETEGCASPIPNASYRAILGCGCTALYCSKCAAEFAIGVQQAAAAGLQVGLYCERVHHIVHAGVVSMVPLATDTEDRG